MTQEESVASTSTDVVVASLASVIAFILLLLIIGGIVLAIIKVLSKRHVENIKMKYISSEGGYLATDSEDSSRVDAGFDNQIVSFN